ncbi:TIGR02099 family protein [Luteimonas sp. MC1782]|uniref:YhdP family protein n=1 Tax=Luteimonas sp. MC1782 TaxID=2760305 RepID=UPI001602061C|nr:YhdP family protein [Luteimonas sp. MC1782]MBB1472128.1 TIGR02099 family protein [Luteimonas sp. MC1782]
MPSPLRRGVRVAWRGAWYVVAIGLVLMALGAGITSQLLPLAERHPDRIAAWLGERAGRTVAFDHVQTEWTRRGPLLRLDGLRIGDGPHAIPIGAAEVLVSQYAGLLPGRSFTELRLRGLELTLERGDDGRWEVRGLPGQAQSGGDPFAALEGLGELQVIDGRLAVLAPALGIDAGLSEVDLRLRVDGARVRIAARAWMRKGVSPLDISAELDRGSGDGRAWLALRDADLEAWSGLRAAGVGAAAGTGRIQAWADLRGNRVTALQVAGKLDDVRLRGSAVAGGVPPSLDFGRVEIDARWSVVAGGWRFDAPRLRVGAGDDAQVLDGLLLADGARRALVADRIDAGPLLGLAALAGAMPPAVAKWLLDTRPGGVLRAVDVAGDASGRFRARAHVEGLRFDAVGDAPGVSGLSGTLSGDADGVTFEFDRQATLGFDWPRGFGPPAHAVRLAGQVTGWRDSEGWHVDTPALRVAGDGYGADVRGGLVFQGDGSRPRVDLVAAIDDANIAVARRFWVRHRMPRAALAWLDAALVGGHVRGGRAVLSGDLDDWPFNGSGQAAGPGMFHARAQLDDVVLRFDPDWPLAEGLDGDVDFVADGFSVAGSARVAGVPLPALSGGIAHFGDAPLLVRADIAGDAGPVLALLRASPLRKGREALLQGLSATGPLRAQFALDLPLHRSPARPVISGRVLLEGATLGDRRWDVAFEDVRGEARYDGQGFVAEGLRVRRDGQAGTLALRAGIGHVADRGNAFEAELGASLAASELAARAPQLAWLGDRLRGRSRWTLAVAIPVDAGADGGGGRLQLRSDLVGTQLLLPAPLDKAAATPLAARIDVDLPLGEGDVDVVLGNRVALRARSRGNRTGVLAVLGGNRIEGEPPASGLVVSGRTPVLDALDWAGLAGGGGGADGGAGGDGLALRRIDVQAGRLQLLGSAFPQTRVVAEPVATGTAVRFDGPALAGGLLLPRRSGAALTARLQRLHFPAPGARAGGGRQTADAKTEALPGEAIDPARIPPLDISVDDLRFGAATLGTARLRTRPTANGLQVEEFHAVQGRQRIDVEGDWLGRGEAARTRVEATLASRDFGSLLSGFGLGQRLDGGEGEANFDATWPGGPAGFRLDALQGHLAVTIKDGRLVEVEPGAGRVLGLLSITELPRRLTLDFRDFFSKGFAFNRIGGTVVFGGGQARSDDMLIDGAAAEISIRGTADLRAQTYDQRIEVVPRTGGLLTAVGALTAGPVGAAVGAMANAVFERPLGRVGAKVYHVTGPWKDPKVEVEGREVPPAAGTAPVDREPGGAG